MQQLMAMTHNQTMTSKEIAELTGREHDSVLRSVRNIHDSLPADLRTGILSTTYVDVNGKSQPMFSLDKNAVLCLISGYDITGRMRIIRRWQELEEIQRQALPQTHIQAVEAYLHTLKTVEAQMLTIGSQQTVIDHKKIRTDDSMTHTTMVRVRKLNTGEKYSSLRLIAYCEDNEISIEKVYDAHDQPVNSYPNEAWENVYPDVILPAHL